MFTERRLRTCRPTCSITLALVLYLSVSATMAETTSACPDRTSIQHPNRGKPKLGPAGKAPLPDVAGTPGPTFLRAEEIERLGQDEFRASGNVELVRNNQRLTTDAVQYNPTTEFLHSPGRATLEDDLGDRFETESITMAMGSRTGETGRASFFLANDLAHGDAESIVFEGEELTRLNKARITTCPVGRDDWFLKASEIELDHAEETGTAWHSTMEFKGIPVMYFPYFSFPITDRRRSGFLVPHVGNSSLNGFTLATPYYINIAPSVDDTFTPRYLSRRGLQLDNEFRYLLRSGRGDLQTSYLPEDEQTDSDRGGWRYRHQNSFGPHWSANIDAERVSDDDYLDDFGKSLATTSKSVLQQTGQLGFSATYWRFSAEATNFQVIDPDLAKSDYPYAMLPNLMLWGDPVRRPNSVNFPTLVQWTDFERDVGVTGKRAFLNPTISLPLRNSYGFVTPKVLGWYMGYDLEHTAGDTRPSQSVSGLSLDTGLIFDRKTQWFGRDFTQTFEPRLFYVTIPYKNQDDLPVFDTALRDISFPTLFQENRYAGGDRVGDTQKLSVGLSTRFLDRESGMERLSLSVGESYYFTDRLVGIPSAPGPETSDRSGMVAEVTTWMGSAWYGRATYVAEPKSFTNQQGTFAVQYNPRPDRIALLGYSHVRDGIEQVNAGFDWPIGGRWRASSAAAYSFEADEYIDSFAGISYNNCCWAVRVYGRHRRLTDGGQDNSVLLQFEFVGLSKVGDAPKSPLDGSFFYSTRLLPGSGPSTLQE